MLQTFRIARRGNIIPVTLVASALVGFIAAMGFIFVPSTPDFIADMRLEPLQKTIALGESFEVDVIVQAAIPVNVFAGELSFDSDTLEVQSISYNTSIADLWAEEPWYSNGDGTLNFIGGTTRRGGFFGTDKLITITFIARNEGAGSLYITDAQILKHDGFGTDITLPKSIDAIFTVESQSTTTPVVNLIQKTAVPSSYAVVPTPPSTDLNGDGKQSMADVSIMLLNLGSKDLRFDLNMDLAVDIHDFNLILKAK